MSAIELDQVAKRYGSRAVIDNLSLVVTPGEFIGLVGLNGAGKSTLFKLILNLCYPDSGHIKVFGNDAGDVAARRCCAYLPERFSPPPYVTGHDYLQFAAGIHGARYDAGTVAATLEDLGFPSQVLSKPVKTYSKGMAQKVGLAGCLLSGRRMLVLDEPMSGLDPEARLLLKASLRKLRDDGVTILFSTHLLVDVVTLCDRVLLMHQGSIRFDGTPAQYVARYGEGDYDATFVNSITESGGTLSAQTS